MHVETLLLRHHQPRQELRHEYEEERKASDRLIEQADRDKQALDGMESR